ncbi:MAG: hypothetical protein ACR2PG_14975 [Hyphomicrobiaceae bacterium]
MNAGTFPADEPKYNLNFESSVIYDLPAERFDLPGWLRNFSTEDYESCTPASGAHRYANVYRDGDGGLVYRNDEYVGGFMMTQFYRERIMEPQRVRLVSLTRARFLHVWPIVFPLYWEMTVEPRDEKSSTFTCKIGAKLNLFYFIASKLTLLNFWSQAHADEETPHFAEHAARWATRND